MPLLQSPMRNLLLGLAAYKRPGLLGQVQQQQNLMAQQQRQAVEDQRRREREDFLFKQQQMQAEQQQGLLGARKQAGELLGMNVPGAQLPLADRQKQALGLLAQAGDPAALSSLVTPKGGFTLGEGDIRYDAMGNVIARGPQKQDASRYKAVDKKLFDTQTNTWIEAPKGMDDVDLKDVMAVSDKYEKRVAPLRTAATAASQLDTLLNRSGAYTDIAAIVTAVKVLDPESIVKEGEVALLTSARSLYDQLKALTKKVEGGGVLTDKLKTDMRRGISDIMKVYEAQGMQWTDFYKRFSEAGNIEPWRVLGPEISFPNMLKGLPPEPPGYGG